MPIYALGTTEPTISSEAFVHPDAVVIGDVTIGSESSIWPGAVLRGDGGGAIRIGANTSIQDNSVIHTTPEVPTIVGDRCVIGHLVHLESCTIEDEVMIGNAAMVLHHSVIHTGAIVAANSVVLYNVDVPSGALAVGSPAVVKLGAAKSDLIALAAAAYTERARHYPSTLRRIG
ncbi:MAG TPA: gamma carbonic anhydrase family protein [Ilumatobacter sp.]|nr:gamma carbonic anhydrase family protein [Ilumatobacter sp.]